MLEGRRFPVDDAVSVIVPMQEAPEIFREWNDDSTRFTKIMIRVD